MAADGFPVALDAVTSACCGFGRVERANQEALSGVYYTKAGRLPTRTYGSSRETYPFEESDCIALKIYILITPLSKNSLAL